MQGGAGPAPAPPERGTGGEGVLSPRPPRVTAAELLRALHHDGWYDDEQVGSHLSLRHATKAGRVIVPVHVGKTLKTGLLARILKDANMTVDEFRRLR